MKQIQGKDEGNNCSVRTVNKAIRFLAALLPQESNFVKSYAQFRLFSTSTYGFLTLIGTLALP